MNNDDRWFLKLLQWLINDYRDLELGRVRVQVPSLPPLLKIKTHSYCDDGDPLDVLVLSSEPFQPLSIVRGRAIGLIRMLDDGKEDDKIIAVYIDDPAFTEITNHDQLPQHIERQILRFFDYKALEGKQLVVEDFLDVEDAQRIISAGISLYAAHRDSLQANGC